MLPVKSENEARIRSRKRWAIAALSYFKSLWIHRKTNQAHLNKINKKKKVSVSNLAFQQSLHFHIEISKYKIESELLVFSRNQDFLGRNVSFNSVKQCGGKKRIKNEKCFHTVSQGMEVLKHTS